MRPTTPTDEMPRIAISVERTINLGNYESAKVYLSVSNLTAASTEGDIEDAIEFQGRVYETLKNRIKELAKEARIEHATTNTRAPR